MSYQGLATVRRLSWQITYAEIAAGGAAAAVVVNIDDPISRSIRIICGTAVRVRTPLAGGSISGATIDIGAGGNADLLDGVDLSSATQWTNTPEGMRPHARYPTGTQLTAKIDLTGDTANRLTSGIVDIDLLYVESL